MRRLPFPDDWSGERALAFAEMLYDIADEIMRQYEGPIRFYYQELDELRRQKDTRQLDLPLPPYPDDFPF